MVWLGPLTKEELPAWARGLVQRNTSVDDPRRSLTDGDLAWLLANGWKPPTIRVFPSAPERVKR